jgi:Mn2+/Fe2+ NRAMP family transporter
MYLSQELNGLLLPLVLVLMLVLINRTGLMGRFTNSRLYNYLAWACVILVSGLAVWLGPTTIFPRLGGS